MMIFVVFLLTFLNIFATDIDKSLYTVTLPIVKQDFNRSDVVAQGLKQVLVKVTGNESVIDNIKLDKSSDSYLEALAYAKQKQAVILQFNQQQIQNLLTSNKYSLWLGKRDKGLLWLVGQDESNQEVARHIIKAAYDRGIKLDFVNNRAIQFNNNFSSLEFFNQQWFNNQLIVNQADYNLVCNINESSYSCKILNTKVLHENLFVMDQSNNLAKDIVSHVVKFLLLNDNANDQSSYFVMRLNNIDDFNDYQKVIVLIKNLIGVHSCEIIEIDESAINLEIVFVGSMKKFMDLLNKNTKFLSKGFSVDQLNNSRIIEYRWMG